MQNTETMKHTSSQTGFVYKVRYQAILVQDSGGASSTKNACTICLAERSQQDTTPHDSPYYERKFKEVLKEEQVIFLEMRRELEEIGTVLAQKRFEGEQQAISLHHKMYISCETTLLQHRKCELINKLDLMSYPNREPCWTPESDPILDAFMQTTAADLDVHK